MEAKLLELFTPLQIMVGSGIFFFILGKYVSRIFNRKNIRDVNEKKVDIHVGINSLVHSVIILQGAIRVLYTYNTNTKFINYPPFIDLYMPTDYDLGMVYMAFSGGYFLYDFYECIIDFKSHGILFVIHAMYALINIILPFAVEMPREYVFYACSVFLFEASGPFYACKTILKNLKIKNSLATLNEIFFAISFFMSRIVYGIPICISFIDWLFKSDLGYIGYITASGVFTSMCLNIFWFYKIVNIIIFKVQKLQEKKNV